MKKIMTLCVLLTLFMSTTAQSLDIAKNFYYYQRFNSAEEELHKHIASKPSDAEAWLWLMKAYTVQNKLSQAIDSLSVVPAGIAEDNYILLAKGHVLLHAGKTDSAMLLFNQVVNDTKSKNATMLGLIAEANAEADKGVTAYALTLLEKAIKRDKNNPELYVIMGDIYLKLHNGTEAYKAYRTALEKKSTYAEADYKLGTIFLSQKNQDVYLQHFNQAIAGDRNYAPAYYELYRHYLYKDQAKALDYFKQYASLSDKTLKLDYAAADVWYLNKEYVQAIDQANKLIEAEGEKVQARLYKLIAYSKAEMKDTATALVYMQRYFQNEIDSNLIVKDFETMGVLFESDPGTIDSAITYYTIAADRAEKGETSSQYFKKLASLAKQKEDFAGEAKWLGRFYAGNDKATNVDLFNWGLASYRAEDYHQADTVFGIYTSKYPEQGFGYYWRARSNAAIDTSLSQGLAIPHYAKLVEILKDDTVTAGNRKWMVQAYSYLAAYETNIEKDYKEAIGYFDKVLEVDPENNDARRYILVLEENLKKEESITNTDN